MMTMMRASRLLSFVTAALFVSIAVPALAQRVVGTGTNGPVPDPVTHETEGLFQAKYASVGDDFYIGGQPTERALRELKAKGVTTVVNLRMPEEMAKIGFDEAALVKELGMRHVYIPMRGSAENPYGPKELDAFAAAISSTDGALLLHCTVAWRASHLWAAYLIRERKMSVPAAVAHARKINLRDDMPMTGTEQPLEGFLGRVVPEIEHRKR